MVNCYGHWWRIGSFFSNPLRLRFKSSSEFSIAQISNIACNKKKRLIKNSSTRSFFSNPLRLLFLGLSFQIHYGSGFKFFPHSIVAHISHMACN